MNANVSAEGRAPGGQPLNEVGKPTPQKPKAPAKAGAAAWLVPTGLIMLSLVPLAGGAFRLTQLAGGVEITSANARFFASPLPVVLHIISVTLYSILGAFQFAPGFRRQRRGWHRAAGRILIPSGLIVALSGLWMTLYRAWGGYAGTSPIGWGIDRWPAECTQPSAADGRGLGDQPRRGRMGHPQAAGPPSPHCLGRCYPFAMSSVA